MNRSVSRGLWTSRYNVRLMFQWSTVSFECWSLNLCKSFYRFNHLKPKSFHLRFFSQQMLIKNFLLMSFSWSSAFSFPFCWSWNLKKETFYLTVMPELHSCNQIKHLLYNTSLKLPFMSSHSLSVLKLFWLSNHKAFTALFQSEVISYGWLKFLCFVLWSNLSLHYTETLRPGWYKTMSSYQTTVNKYCF